MATSISSLSPHNRGLGCPAISAEFPGACQVKCRRMISSRPLARNHTRLAVSPTHFLALKFSLATAKTAVRPRPGGFAPGPKARPRMRAYHAKSADKTWRYRPGAIAP